MAEKMVILMVSYSVVVWEQVAADKLVEKMDSKLVAMRADKLAG